MSAPPRIGLTLPATVLEVHDGDTLRVELRIVADVRLCGDAKKKLCYAPELKEPGGIESHNHLVRNAVGQHGRRADPR